jgi:hypothetical protein
MQRHFSGFDHRLLLLTVIGLTTVLAWPHDTEISKRLDGCRPLRYSPAFTSWLQAATLS